MVQIVTLTGTLTDTSEDRVTTVGLGDVVDQLLNEDGLADTGTTEETNLSTTGVGGEEVDDLDTSDENLGGGGLVDELGGLGVNGKLLVGLDGATLVNGVTSDVDDTAQSRGADGNGDGGTGVGGLGATDETLSTWKSVSLSAENFFQAIVLTVHGNATDDILTQVLLLKCVRCGTLRQYFFSVSVKVRTDTSRTSFWLLFVVSRAFRMAGSLAVSNLTAL